MLHRLIRWRPTLRPIRSLASRASPPSARSATSGARRRSSPPRRQAGDPPAGRARPRTVPRSRHPRAARSTPRSDALADRDWQVRQAAEDLARPRLTSSSPWTALQLDSGRCWSRAGRSRAAGRGGWPPPGRPRREVDVLGASAAGLVEGGPVERLTDALAPGRSSTTTSSIHAFSPVGIGYMASVRLPTIAPSSRATNRAHPGCRRSPRAGAAGGGDDADSCGISRSKRLDEIVADLGRRS